MAELVHRNLESMLPELEELERSSIFSHEEIRQIVRRRRNLEYRLRRRPARKADFLRAIQYEVNLDLLRKHRKKNLGLMSTRADAEFGVQNRIHFLFRRALKIFKADLKLWLQYIEFSKRCRHRNSLTKTFGQALSFHPHNPGLWVMAAKFEFEDLKDVASARALLQQGLRANSQDRLLWREYFRMELMHVDKVRKRQAILGLDVDEDEEVANVSDEFLAYKTASVVYHQAVKAISDDIEFRLSFLPVYQLFEETEARQQEVYDSVRTDFPSHPLCWDALARRLWTGVDTATLTDSQVVELEKETERIFGEGLESVGNESDTTPLWEKYIEWCRERIRDCSTSETLQTKAVQRLLAILKRASEECLLSVAVFEQYIHTLQQVGLTQEALAVSTRATQAYPCSVPLWLLRLRSFRCHTREASHASLSELCRQALDGVPKESSLPLWQYWVEQSIGGGATAREVEGVFQAGMECGVRAVREALSSQYLDWALIVGGMRKARKIYHRLLAVQPVAHSLYRKCIAVEKSAEQPSMTRLRDLYERAVRDHGSHCSGLWLDFIRSELSYPGGRVEAVGRLHWRAVKELQPELTADFISEYSLMQATQ